MVALAALGEGLDSMILEDFSNLNDSVILSPWQFAHKSLRQFSLTFHKLELCLFNFSAVNPLPARLPWALAYRHQLCLWFYTYKQKSCHL